jgi:hypothetical protein
LYRRNGHAGYKNWKSLQNSDMMTTTDGRYRQILATLDNGHIVLFFVPDLLFSARKMAA